MKDTTGGCGTREVASLGNLVEMGRQNRSIEEDSLRTPRSTSRNPVPIYSPRLGVDGYGYFVEWEMGTSDPDRPQAG